MKVRGVGMTNEEPSTFSCENCKYELLSPEVEPCCDCKNAHKNYFEAKTSETTEMTREEPSVNETLDKIRAEIETLPNANPSYWHSGDMVDRDDVIEIIDKYKAESEVSK